MKTALSLINQAYVRGLARTGPVRNGTDGIAAGDWEVSAVEAVDFWEIRSEYSADGLFCMKFSYIDFNSRTNFQLLNP